MPINNPTPTPLLKRSHGGRCQPPADVPGPARGGRAEMSRRTQPRQGFPSTSAAPLLAGNRRPGLWRRSGKAISIRGGSPRSQANTDKLCNTCRVATLVIYPLRSQSAGALREALAHTPAPVSWRLKGKGNKREAKEAATAKLPIFVRGRGRGEAEASLQRQSEVKFVFPHPQSTSSKSPMGLSCLSVYFPLVCQWLLSFFFFLLVCGPDSI